MSHLQGPVPLGNSSYRQRPFETDVVRELLNRRWVLLVGPRQHGKTSALVRVRRTLKESGVQTALVDLQAAPPHATYEELVIWFCKQVQDQLGVVGVQNAGSDLGSLLALSLPSGATPVAVLIDEASAISDPNWRNAFYGQLRAISGRRAHARPEEAPARLLLAFAGTFRPETLIDAANSPFNVCERIDTGDLTLVDVKELTSDVLGRNEEGIAQLIYEEVGGQPYLFQRLLSKIAGSDNFSNSLVERTPF